ncbi:MAG: hypothetical protein WDO18_21335 [Acidobacteriota bacterium]
MGIAFLLWALYAAQSRESTRAAVLLGLGIASNLTIAIPAVALIMIIAIARRQPREAFLAALIAGGIAVAICAYPMRGASPGHFYVGFPDGLQSATNLIYVSTRAVSAPAGLFGTEAASQRIALWILPAIGLLWTVLFLRRREELLVPLVLAISISAVIAAHVLLGAPYPVDRTGLYLMALALLTCAILADAPGTLPALQGGILPVLVLQFTLQLQTRTFRVWPYNDGSKELALRLLDECQGRAPASITVGTYFTDQPSLEFYRQRYSLACVKPMDRLLEPYVPGYNYFVVTGFPLAAQFPDAPKIYAGPRGDRRC